MIRILLSLQQRQTGRGDTDRMYCDLSLKIESVLYVKSITFLLGKVVGPNASN